MAHKKGQGSTAQKGNTLPKNRGVKHFGGENVISGTIIVRQVGTKYHPGKNVGMGRDFTIYAKKEGIVQFKNKSSSRKIVNVI